MPRSAPPMETDGLHPSLTLTRDPYSPVMIVATVMATIGVLAYAWFLLNPAHRGDLLPWLLVIVAEVVLVFHALMAMWTVLAGRKDPRGYAFHSAQRDLHGPDGPSDDPAATLHLHGRPVSVDVLITVYGEPLPVIRRTAEAAIAIRGEHKTWLLDDGNSDAVRDLAAELECGYVRRLTNHGAKAGNVNNALTIAKGDFFVILDADFVASPQFLEETLPFMEDAEVAFVQTPQTYGNLHNFISRGAGYMQTMFYRFIQPGRNQFNAAFCVGTNVLFRREAVLDVGGMHTQSKSEDVWTSLIMHERGWKSVFIADALAIGDAPDTIEAYSKQQLRWATGGFEIMLTHNPLSRKRALTLDQRFMYFVTATHYLTGIVPGLLLFVPALEIFFDLRPVNLDVGPLAWVLFYSGFYVMQVVLAALTLGTFRWEVLMLASSSFPIYVRALRNAFIGVDQKWHVTGTTGRASSAFNFMIPQVLVFVFLLGTTFVSIWRDLTMSQFNIATFWNLVNTVALGAFVVVGDLEHRRTRSEHHAPTRAHPPGARRETGPVTPVLDREAVKEAARDRLALAGAAPASETHSHQEEPS